MRNAHVHGAHAALETYGLSKEAGAVSHWLGATAGNVAGWGVTAPGRAYQAVRSPDWWRAQGQAIKEGLVGHPTAFWNQLRQGQLFQKDTGMMRQALKPHNALDFALSFGLPALQLYGVSQAPPEYRGSAIGQAVGSIAGSFAGRPLGMLGQVGASTVLGALGQTLGRPFDSARPPPAAQQEQVPEQQDQSLGATTRRPW